MKWMEGSSGAEIQAKNKSSEGSKPGTAKYSIVVEVKPSHNGEFFICHTSFDKPQSQDHAADNIPVNNRAFNERYTTSRLTVYCKYLFDLNSHKRL